MSYKFIWKINLKDSYTEEDFIKFWKEASSILQEYPGAIGTKIHRVEGEEKTYLAIAEWESKAARDAMQQDAEKNESERAKRWNKFPKNESFGKAEFIARAEEIDSVYPQ